MKLADCHVIGFFLSSVVSVFWFVFCLFLFVGTSAA
jgi:hypothetical protein